MKKRVVIDHILSGLSLHVLLYVEILSDDVNIDDCEERI